MALDTDSAVLLAALVVGLLGGMAVPVYYGIERLSGFGRWVVNKLPYDPPPGKGEEEALEETTDTADGGWGDDGD